MITQLLALLAEANDDIRELERVQEKLLTVTNDLEELNQQIEDKHQK